jgi:hypothetical protein
LATEQKNGIITKKDLISAKNFGIVVVLKDIER